MLTAGMSVVLLSVIAVIYFIMQLPDRIAKLADARRVEQLLMEALIGNTFAMDSLRRSVTICYRRAFVHLRELVLRSDIKIELTVDGVVFPINRKSIATNGCEFSPSSISNPWGHDQAQGYFFINATDAYDHTSILLASPRELFRLGKPSPETDFYFRVLGLHGDKPSHLVLRREQTGV